MSDHSNVPNSTPQRYWLGMPVSWDWKNWNKAMWNPQESRLFPPKRVGIGWTINFHAVGKALRLLK
jgi:uncharacterized membrane protein